MKRGVISWFARLTSEDVFLLCWFCRVHRTLPHGQVEEWRLLCSLWVQGGWATVEWLWLPIWLNCGLWVEWPKLRSNCTCRCVAQLPLPSALYGERSESASRSTFWVSAVECAPFWCFGRVKDYGNWVAVVLS